MRIRLFFAWFNCWIGFYWDRDSRILYLAPLPCVIFRIEGLTAKWDAIRAMRRAEFERSRPDCGQCEHPRFYHNSREGCTLAQAPHMRVCQCTWSGEGINLAVYDPSFRGGI